LGEKKIKKNLQRVLNYFKLPSMQNADYRKINDRSQNSSTYHKKDGANVRAKLKVITLRAIKDLV